MKYFVFVVVFSFFISCKQEKKEMLNEEASKEIVAITTSNNYSEKLQQVFEAHGGVAQWKKMQSLVFELPKPDAREIHTINLQTRQDKVETPSYTIGYDGIKTWLLDTDNSFKGDAVFYHNLMFYFYAMPFVLADDGIVYGETAAVVYEGKSYPGVSIRYNPGVGTSYKDLYFIHFDPDTKQMAWLGYSVSYRSGESSDKFSWIHYNDWQTISGLVLPKSITWYKTEDGVLTEPRNTVSFENVVLGKDVQPNTFFSKPEAAVFVEGKIQE